MAPIKFGHILAHFGSWFSLDIFHKLARISIVNCIISFGYITQIGKNIPLSFVLFPLDIFHKLAWNYDWYASTWQLISFGYISQIVKNILWIYFTNWQEYTNIICIISFRYISQIGKKLRLICQYVGIISRYLYKQPWFLCRRPGDFWIIYYKVIVAFTSLRV